MSYLNPLTTGLQSYQLPQPTPQQNSLNAGSAATPGTGSGDGITLSGQPSSPTMTIPPSIPASPPPTTATPPPPATSPPAATTPTTATSSDGIEVGIFQDDNGVNTGHSTGNDASNRQAINQSDLSAAAAVTAQNPNVHLTTYETNTEAGSGTNQAVAGTVDDGTKSVTSTTSGVDPSVQGLANFVSTTLTNADKNNSQAYLELAGHGNESGLLYSANGTLMTPQQISQAITEGEQQHAQASPANASRTIQGVILNSCDGDSQEFIDALSQTDVKTLVGGPNAVNDLSPQMFPDLTNPQGNAQHLAQAANASTGPDSPPTPDVAVQNIGGGTGTTLSQDMTNVDSAIESDIASNPSQRAVIANDLNAIPQDGTENNGPASTSLNKPSAPVYQALIADQNVAQSVRTAAQTALNELNTSTLAEVNTPSNAADGLVDVSSDHGTNAFLPSATTEQEDQNDPLVQALYG